jgi:N-acetylneuraminic acid mutarotase
MVPGSRHSHTAVWTGSEMIVWGGAVSAPSIALNDGGRFDPTSPAAWVPLSQNGAPTGRYGHSAVWTGAEMIVWGGTPTSGDLLITGGRYHPTDGWSPTLAGGTAPAARTGHSAVWTGTEMIVWGGVGQGSALLGSGGRYDPAANTWQTVSTTNAPSARFEHSAVWTGTELIIWGGNADPGANAVPLATGARYDPVTNTWTKTATAGAPAMRRRHTAVWTGTEMLVYGGDGGTSSLIALNDGGRYNPTTNTWSALPAETFRTGHTAIWTGSAMIAWGGFSSSGNVEAGARYSPDEDEWTPLSVTASPLGRSVHTAVWTGAEMIIYGGAIGGPGTSSGGRYVP